jgi:phosphomannomutase
MTPIPKLLAFDLDGTLAESKQPLTLEMGVLLSQVLSRMPVAILSGAAFAQYKEQFFPAFPSNTHFKNLYIFPDNAAQCYVFKDDVWQVQYDHKFTEVEKARIMSTLADALAETKINDSILHLWGPQIEDRGAQITFSALGQHAPTKEKEVWDPHHEKRQPLYTLLMERLPDFSVGLNATTSIDITRHGITKAYGVCQLSELTGIPLSHMLYVGDALGLGGNDAVVIQTGIPTHQVSGPEETRDLLKEFLL